MGLGFSHALVVLCTGCRAQQCFQRGPGTCCALLCLQALRPATLKYSSQDCIIAHRHGCFFGSARYFTLQLAATSAEAQGKVGSSFGRVLVKTLCACTPESAGCQLLPSQIHSASVSFSRSTVPEIKSSRFVIIVLTFLSWHLCAADS